MKIRRSLERYEFIILSALAVLMVTLTGLLLNAGFHSQVLV